MHRLKNALAYSRNSGKNGTETTAFLISMSGLFSARSPFMSPGSSNPRASIEAEFTAAREQMVEEQLSVSGRDIRNARVLKAMATVPRHEFMPEALRKDAYADGAFPIGYDQTISQPYVVALMTEQLDPKPTDRVLEIGTGCGYQTAVLSLLVAEVCTVEIVEALAKRAQADLMRLGYNNVKVLVDDGHKGWLERAPFDAVIVTCAPEQVPQALVDQLKDGGRMIIPVGSALPQELCLLRKNGQKVERQAVLPVYFVSMSGKGAVP